jgi:hypothetical protein
MFRALIFFFLFPDVGFAGPRIVGNGGEFLGDTPLAIEQIQVAIQKAKRPILSWLYRQEIDQTIPQEFFDNRLYHWIDQVEVFLGNETTCRDSLGPADAAGYMGLIPRICIGAERALEALRPGDFEVQLQGIILHELLHFVGSGEDESDRLQIQYVHEMKYINEKILDHYHAEMMNLLLSGTAFENEIQFPSLAPISVLSLESYELMKNPSMNAQEKFHRVEQLLENLRALRYAYFNLSEPTE